ncbi:MAG: NAD(P)H-hydrate dehydratase [bacterium]
MRIVTGKACIAADKKTIASGISGRTLMKRAASGLADFLNNFGAKNVVFVLGAGNNAGDGVVASGLLKKNITRNVFCIFPANKVNDNVKWAGRICGEGIVFQPSLNELKESFKTADCIIDCIFGTGFHGEVRGFTKSVIRAINNSGIPVVACDVPSGIDSNTGQYSLAVRASFTVTFGFPKLGLFLEPARFLAGSVRAVDIGLKKPEIKSFLQMTTSQEIRSKIPIRTPLQHKYGSGHVLVFAGKMKGAAALAALGALRTGSGLLTIVTDKKIDIPEAIQIGYGTDLSEYIRRKKVRSVVFGCGWGREDGSILKLLSKIKVPKVIDADGIYLLKKFKYFGKIKNCILTPHTGEMKNLTSKDLNVPGKWEVVKEVSRKLKAVVLLKGFQTVISDGLNVFINPTGNPVLATGGTGDLLSGMIAGFISQGMKNPDAVKAAAYIHGLTADILLKEKGGRGILVREIAAKIPRTIKKLLENRAV